MQRLEQPGVSLDKRVEAAGQRFLREQREGLFLTGHLFPGRDSVHMGDSRDREGHYGVRIREGEITIRRSRRSGGDDDFTVHTEAKGGGPTGLFLLFRMSGGQARLVDSTVFDPDKSFAFDFKLPRDSAGKSPEWRTRSRLGRGTG